MATGESGVGQKGTKEQESALPQSSCPSGGGIKNGHIGYPSYGGMHTHTKTENKFNSGLGDIWYNDEKNVKTKGISKLRNLLTQFEVFILTPSSSGAKHVLRRVVCLNLICVRVYYDKIKIF